MKNRRIAKVGLSAALALALSSAPAPAAIPSPGFVPCEPPSGSDVVGGPRVPAGSACGTATVPLDHSGRVAGTLDLDLIEVPALDKASGTLVVLTGGPGQAATPLAPDLSRALARARLTHDLLFVDQRGTGVRAIECRPIESATDVGPCATRLGKQRPFLTTRETALDLEDLRDALKIDRLTLFGISYGAKVAGEYARRFPDRTAGLVLDSPTPVDGLDALSRLPQLGLPRVLREVCSVPKCAFLSDPTLALRTLVRRLQRSSLRGRAVGPSGRTTPARVTAGDVYELVSRSDLDPVLRAELPAAIAAGVLHDPAPLLRLLTATAGDRDPTAAGVNEGRLLATTCVEGRLPWAPESPLSGRRQALARVIAQTPAAAFDPFGATLVLRNSLVSACLRWPSTPQPEGVPSRGPDVPVLVIGGREDLRTPLEDARRTASQYPHGQVLSVPGVGHSVLGNDPSTCTSRAIAAFLAGRTVSRCSPGMRRSFPAAPLLPATVSVLRSAPGVPGRAGRVATAVAVTLLELDRVLEISGPLGNQRLRIAGLRGGVVTTRRGVVTLRAFEVVRGVRVTGALSRTRARLTVTGPAGLTGALSAGSGNVLRGTIGGRPVALDLS